jgi:hypothetical protein
MDEKDYTYRFWRSVRGIGRGDTAQIPTLRDVLISDGEYSVIVGDNLPRETDMWHEIKSVTLRIGYRTFEVGISWNCNAR